jgi:hypothetical protein
MWFGSILALFPKSRPAARSRNLRDKADRRRRARRLLLEPLESRRVLAFSPFSDDTTTMIAPRTQIAGDFTGDGRDDLVVGNNASTLQLFTATSSGDFAPPITLSQRGLSVAAGDLNADGHLDLITEASIALGNGNGTFQTPTGINLPPQIPIGYSSAVPQTAASVAVGDLNADGKLDLVITGRSSISVYTGSGPYGPYFNTYTSSHANVLLGNGDGTVQPAVVSSFSQQQGVERESAALAHLNDDNGDSLVDGNDDLDLVIMSRDIWREGGYALLGQGNGSFAPTRYIPASRADKVALGDIDSDGLLDLVSHTITDVYISRGLAGGGFAQPSLVPLAGPPAIPRSVAVGDIDGDGKLDLVVTTQRLSLGVYGYYDNPYPYGGSIRGTVHDGVKVLLGNGNATFQAPIISQLGVHEGNWGPVVHSSQLADVNGDDRLDLIFLDHDQNRVTVVLNDGIWEPLPSLNIQDVSIVEGTGGTTNAVFTVTLEGAPSGDVSVNYATSGNLATAGVDYTTTAGTLTFGPGVTSRMITVPIAGDALDEFNEDFNVTLTNPVNAMLVDDSAVGRILDDDAAPTISIGDVSALEGHGENGEYKLFAFTVSLSSPSGKFVTFYADTVDGTASVAGNDFYRNTQGPHSIDPGLTSYVVNVAVRGDRTSEADETFFVNLTSAAEATVADGQGVGTILNDDSSTPPPPPAPLPQINISDAQVTEGNSGTRTMTFTVTLSKASNKEVRVNYGTANGTARTSDSDYTSTSGTLKFAPGQTTKTVTVTVRGDKKVESNEDFYLLLSGATNGTIGDGKAVGTILNDDGGGSAPRSSSARAAAVDAAIEHLMFFSSKRRG